MTANFKAWIKGSCHLLLITWFQDCVHFLCPSSESFPAFFSCDIYSIKPFLWCLTECLQVIPGCIPLGFLWQALYIMNRFIQLRPGFDVLRNTDWFYARYIPLSSAIFAITHQNPFFRYHPTADLPCLSLCPLFVATVASGFCPLAISHFLFFSCPHLLVFLPLPAHIFGYLFPIALLSVLLSSWPCRDVRSDRTTWPTKRGWIPLGSPVDIKRSCMLCADP